VNCWWLLLLALGSEAGFAADRVCGRSTPASGALATLTDAMAHGRFIAYQPTSLRVSDGQSTQAGEDEIRADLKVLRPRFDALITYGAVNGAQKIPQIAAALGFRAVIIGVWDPFDTRQMNTAIATAMANPLVVAGLSLGNEMVFSKRRTFGELAALVLSVRRRAPAVPLSTTEPFHMFYLPASAELLGRLDFLLPNVHPVFQSWFREAPDDNAARFVLSVVTNIAEVFCGPILVKEVGVPTAPARRGFTPERQASFFEQLRLTFPPSDTRAFAYFSAFDAPWRAYDQIAAAASESDEDRTAEAHWGLYDENRRPKPVIRQIALLSSAAR
jgi:exo-beta-1,3-glucanase (GH17 family)